MEVDAVAPGGAGAPDAPAWFPPSQPIVPAAEAIGRAAASTEPPPSEERTYEGVSWEDGTWVADITIDGDTRRLGTFATAGAAGWAYDAAREERGLPAVNFPLPGQAQAPVAERVLAMAAEPSTTPRDEASPSPTATNDSEVVLRDEGATPEWWPAPAAPQAEVVPNYTPPDHEQSHDGAPRRSDRTAPRADTVETASVHGQVAAKVSAAAARPEPRPRPADERAERDKAAEEGALQPRRRSTPAKKRVAPTGPATWLSTEGADAVRSWRSTLTPDAWDALAAAGGLTLNNVPARGWHREVKAATAPLPPAPKPHVASTTSAWVAACTDLLELAAKEKGGLAGLRGELESRGFRCGEPKWEGKEFDVSMPQEFPCYYDIVGKDYTVGYRQDFMSSKSGLVTYLEGCIALAQTGRTYRTTADREADGDEAARRAGKRATKAQICFHHPGQSKASDALRSRSAVERYLAADATPLFESPPLDAFSFENDVAGDFPSPPPGYYSRLSANVVEQLRPAAPAFTAAPAKTPAPKNSQRRTPSDYRGVRGTVRKDAATAWKTEVGVNGTRVRIDHATEREAAISYDAVRVWYRGEARLNFPERWPGDGSSVYAGVTRNTDAVTTHAPWRAHHDGRELGSFDDEKVAARVYDFARHCQGQPVVNFNGSGEGGETFCAYCEDWEYRAVAEQDGASLIKKYGRRFFEDPDHPEDVYYVVPTGVQWTDTGIAIVKVDAVGPTDIDPGQVVEGGAITYLLNDQLRKMIAATPQGLMIVSNEGSAPEPQPSLAVLKEEDDEEEKEEKKNADEDEDPEAENRHWVTGVGWRPGPAPSKNAPRAARMAIAPAAPAPSVKPRAKIAKPHGPTQTGKTRGPDRQRCTQARNAQSNDEETLEKASQTASVESPENIGSRLGGSSALEASESVSDDVDDAEPQATAAAEGEQESIESDKTVENSGTMPPSPSQRLADGDVIEASPRRATAEPIRAQTAAAGREARPPAVTSSRKRPRPDDDDTTAAENARLREELSSLRAATQALEEDLRASEANVSDLTRQRDFSGATAEAAERRADRYGRQRDEARGEADRLRGDVKRLRRERDEVRGDAKRLRRERDESRKEAASLRQKLDEPPRDVTPARPAKRGRHSPTDEPIDERAEEPVDEAADAALARRLQAEEDAAPRQAEEDAWPVVGSHVQHSDGLRGVVTQLGNHGKTEVTTRTGFTLFAYRTDLTPTTLSAEESALCDPSRLTPNEWNQAQLDGAIGVKYKGREFGNCFATKDGRTQRMFTVESNGDVRCALCDWTAPSCEPSSLQNDPSAWRKWVVAVKGHCGQYASTLKLSTTQLHVERVLAIAAEPSSSALSPHTPSPPASAEPSRERRVVDGEVMPANPPAPALAEPTTPASLLQAQIDEAIRIRDDDGQTFRNCFTSCDGTEMRQFVVSATGGVRCAICCGDASFARSSRTPLVTQLHDMKKHCGQYESERSRPQARAHLERLRLLAAGAPAPRTEEEPADEARDAAPRQVVEGADDNAWPVVGSHVRQGDLRGVVTKRGGGQSAYFEVTTKTGYAVNVPRKELAPTTLSAEEAALCDRSRLTPNEWVQAQLDGAICATYEGREFGNCFATKDGRSQRMFTVESNGDVRCALCDWTARSGEPSALQNDLRAWGKWVTVIKNHCGEFASMQNRVGTRNHVARVLAMAAEPSEPSPAEEPADEARDADPRQVVEGADDDWPIVGSHVQHSDELRGVVTQLGYNGFTEVTTKTGYAVNVFRTDLTKITLTAEEAALCDRSRLTPTEWLQSQLDGAVCAVYEGRTFGNCFATKDGRSQRTFTVESNGDVRCALCDWTARSGKPSALKNDLSAWGKWFTSIKGHCAQTPSSLKQPATRRHVECVLAMAAEPSESSPAARELTNEPESVVARPPPDDAGVRRSPRAVPTVPYPVDALVEARWRGGSKFYPALVTAATCTTVDLKYVDDSDEEDEVPVELVRPANRRLLQRYQELTGKRTPPPNVTLPPPPPTPSLRQFDKGSKCVAPWSDGQMYPATVVWVGASSARVEFNDGAMKTLPYEELASPSENSTGAASGPAGRQALENAPPPLPTDPCAICMSTISEDACVLACGHAFHAACLGDLADHVRLAAPTRRSLGVSCPLCRKVTRAEVGAEED